MSTISAMESVSTTASAGSKKKNNKKKKAANKPKDLLETADANAPQEQDDEPETPVAAASDEEPKDGPPANAHPEVNGHAPPPTSNGHVAAVSSLPDRGADAKLEAMSEEREALKREVEELRKELESIRANHDEEMTSLKTELEETQAAKEEAETQYQTLMGRVGQIKETLSDRLKRDRQELEEAKERIEDLETQNEELRTTAATAEGRIRTLEDELQETSREANTLRSRTNLSQQNWSKEKDELAKRVAHLTAELESASNAMGEWEVIAMEERSVKETLADKASEMEEQLAALRENYEGAASERDSHSQAVDKLQKALQELQETRKRELREMVETSEEQLQALKRLVQEADARARAAETDKATMSAELERMAPFEKEIKEKNLHIGKLRHEAIVLNDHLIKALRVLKKTKPEENVDRQVVTNHLLHFLGLDRADPKRFQILQVMAGYLGWTDEQREQAGLARPGTSSTSLRLPASPFHRTPSTPSLKEDFFSEPTPTSAKESLADLWANFLERSVEDAQGGDAAAAGRRKDSASSSTTAATRPDVKS